MRLHFDIISLFLLTTEKLFVYQTLFLMSNMYTLITAAQEIYIAVVRVGYNEHSKILVYCNAYCTALIAIYCNTNILFPALPAPASLTCSAV